MSNPGQGLDRERLGMTALARRRILLAEDEPIVREAMVGMIEALGHAVVEVRDGVEALDRFREAPDAFDLVLLDLSMPRLGGVGALEQIWALRPDIPAVLSSGHPEQRRILQMQSRGTVTFLQKPFSLTELSASLLMH